MAIAVEDQLHGAVILQILESLEELGQDFNFKFNSKVSRSAYKFSITNERNGTIKNVGLYIKTSRSPLSPWRYTFTRAHQEEVLQLKNSCDNVFTLFIAGEDGIAMISYDLLKTILDDTFDDTEWVSVSRKPHSNYRVSGKDGKMENPLPRNSFPNQLTDYLTEAMAEKSVEPPLTPMQPSVQKSGLRARIKRYFT